MEGLVSGNGHNPVWCYKPASRIAGISCAPWGAVLYRRYRCHVVAVVAACGIDSSKQGLSASSGLTQEITSGSDNTFHNAWLSGGFPEFAALYDCRVRYESVVRHFFTIGDRILVYIWLVWITRVIERCNVFI